MEDPDRAAACGHENFIGHDYGFFLRRPIRRAMALAYPRSGHLADLVFRLDQHDLAKVRSGDSGDFGLLLREELGIPPEDRDGRPHRGQEESVLRGDIPASDHRDARGKLSNSQDRVAREVAGLHEAWNLRDNRFRAGAEEDLGSPDLGAVDAHRVRRHEFRGRMEVVEVLGTRQPLADLVDVLVNQGMHALHHLDEVDGPQFDIESEAAGPPDRPDEFRGVEQDLGRDAPAGQADPARLVPVDDRDLDPRIRFDPGPNDRHDRSGAHRNDVVFSHSLPWARGHREPLMPSVHCTMSSSEYTNRRDGSWRRRGTRKRLDVDALTVAVVRLGARHGLSTPVNSFTHDLLKL